MSVAKSVVVATSLLLLLAGCVSVNTSSAPPSAGPSFGITTPHPASPTLPTIVLTPEPVVTEASTERPPTESPPTGTRPDIVVVMVDDLAYTDSRILERLPNINDLFLEHGLSFTSAYNETPLCCPGRAGFLTGQHTREHGVDSNQHGATLLDPSHTLAPALHDVGYQTGQFGKYLNDAAELTDKTPPGWDRVVMAMDTAGNPSHWAVDGQMVTAGYMDRYSGDQSVDWVDTLSADDPFFMWLNPHAPHYKAGGSNKPWLPDIEPQHANDPACAGIAPWLPPTYAYTKQPMGFPLTSICQSLLTVDDTVGELRQKMADLGRVPLWILVSDNGMGWGQKGCVHKNQPLAGQVPLYFAGPGVTAGTTNALVSNIDLGPTLADKAAASMPWADGVSYSGLLNGGAGGRSSMIEDHPKGGSTGCFVVGPWHGVRTPLWHLIKINGTATLYDVVNDPWEQTPVARHTALRKRLKALFPYAWSTLPFQLSALAAARRPE